MFSLIFWKREQSLGYTDAVPDIGLLWFPTAARGAWTTAGNGWPFRLALLLPGRQHAAVIAVIYSPVWFSLEAIYAVKLVGGGGGTWERVGFGLCFCGR